MAIMWDDDLLPSEAHIAGRCMRARMKWYVSDKSGDRLLIVPVLGLSCAKCRRRCGGSDVLQASSSSDKSARFLSVSSYDALAGKTSSRTLERMRAARNSASALESLVDSPGSVA